MDERQWDKFNMAGTHSRRGTSVLSSELHHSILFRYGARNIHWHSNGH